MYVCFALFYTLPLAVFKFICRVVVAVVNVVDLVWFELDWIDSLDWIVLDMPPYLPNTISFFS